MRRHRISFAFAVCSADCSGGVSASGFRSCGSSGCAWVGAGYFLISQRRICLGVGRLPYIRMPVRKSLAANQMVARTPTANRATEPMISPIQMSEPVERRRTITIGVAGGM